MGPAPRPAAWDYSCPKVGTAGSSVVGSYIRSRLHPSRPAIEPAGPSSRDGVPARGLGTVQRPVRGHQEVALARLARVELREPDADRDETRRIAEPAPYAFDPGAQRFRHPRPALEVRAGQDDHELVATIARRHVRGAHGVPDLAGHRPQDLVARLVPVLVVHFLEAVEVQEQDREPLIAALAALDLEGQPVTQDPVGRQAGHRVDRRRPLRLVRPALLVRGALAHRCPPQRGRLGEPLTRLAAAGPAVPGPPVWTPADLLED